MLLSEKKVNSMCMMVFHLKVESSSFLHKKAFGPSCQVQNLHNLVPDASRRILRIGLKNESYM
jgi:hypothetical protein